MKRYNLYKKNIPSHAEHNSTFWTYSESLYTRVKEHRDTTEKEFINFYAGFNIRN